MKQRIFLALLIVFASFSSCKDDAEVIQAPIISGLKNAYTILADAELVMTPTVENDNNASYIWQLDGTEVAKTLDYVFMQSEPRDYKLKLKVVNEGGFDENEITITVADRGAAPLISDVDEEFSVEVDADLTITPTITSENESTYVWFVGDEEVATTLEYKFNRSQPGKYDVTFKATNQGGTTEKVITIVVEPKDLNIEIVAHEILLLEAPAYIKNNEDIVWKILETPTDLYRLSDTKSKTPLFIAAKEGKYKLEVSSANIKTNVNIIVAKATKDPSPYFTKAYDYLPAPGQFVNKMPAYVEGDTHEDMVAKVAKALVGENTSMITLGGWGGYVTMGFDHTIVNVAGKMDFRIEGNGFAANSNPDPTAPLGGSCEPGIIMVSYDANGNGKPDDEWYEINGSANFSAKNELFYQKGVDNKNDMNTYRDFEMTYNKPKVEDPANITDYIYWTNNKGQDGYKFKHSFHRQSYYPLWVSEDKLTFNGVRLAENGIDESGAGSYFVLYAFKYGYADNYSNMDERSAIDIDWAIDKNGNKANLPGIDFVKIYNGVDQENGWLGEASTEVSKGYDLHLLGKSINTITQ